LVDQRRQSGTVLLESFTGGDQRYRGQPTTADVSIAMGFAGHMMIELIQPRDDKPSVYREIVQARGYGFHHLGIAFEDVEAERVKHTLLASVRGLGRQGSDPAFRLSFLQNAAGPPPAALAVSRVCVLRRCVAQ
jgi:hypothetical protein